MTRDWVPVSVAAKRLGLAPRTVRDLIDDERLVAEPMNPRAPERLRWKISLESIDAFIEARRKLFASGRSRHSKRHSIEGGEGA
jgi:hypothetical protein